MRDASLVAEPVRSWPGRRVAIALGNTLAFSVSGGPGAGGCAREELRERFGRQLDPEVVDLAQLLLSEVINNCVVHGISANPDAWIDVTASIYRHTLCVEVSDGGPSFRHEPRLPAPDVGQSRGLYLVQELSSRWGISDARGATVWFELERCP